MYRAPKPNFALIRASASDETGNLSMEDESIRGTVGEGDGPAPVQEGEDGPQGHDCSDEVNGPRRFYQVPVRTNGAQ